ncbi:MAG: HPr kinase/phosphorylase [Pseudorhodobacter sp.]
MKGAPGSTSDILHASCVAVAGRGALILGPSGSGKSSLALEMMAHGAALVADDRVMITREAGRLIASCPPAISGLIEARGVGLLHADPAPPVELVLAVDLAQQETQRLPMARGRDFMGIELDLVFSVPGGHLAVALLQYLAHGRAK